MVPSIALFVHANVVIRWLTGIVLGNWELRGFMLEMLPHLCPTPCTHEINEGITVSEDWKG